MRYLRTIATLILVALPSRLRAGDRFIAPTRATGIAARFDRSPARCQADGASAADHDAANARDQ